MQHKRNRRVVFYLYEDEAQRLDDAISDSDMTRADWLRQAVASAADGATVSTRGNTSEAPEALAVAHERIRGLEELLQQARERQGMSDALNQELNARLEESHATVDRFQLMLPAAGQTRQWWRFW